jgi:hypothetical protein
VRRSALILAALSASVALGGCSLGASSSTTGSSGSFTGTQGQIASTLNLFSSDAGSSDEAGICSDVLDSRVVSALAKYSGGCKTVLTNQLKTVGDTSLTVESITVHGNTATAQVQVVDDGRKVIQKVSLRKQSAGWRLDSIA